MNTLAICTDYEDSINDYNTAVNFLRIKDDVYPKLLAEWQCISKEIDNYLVATKLEYLQRNFPETKFIKQYYSNEAWRVTEAIEKLLQRMKNFFQRTIQYIKVFVVVRLGAAAQVIKRWAETCDKNSNKVEEYIKGIDKKDMSVTSLTELMFVATSLYTEFQDMFTKITNMTVSAAASGDNANSLVEEPSRYQDWLKRLEQVEKENPRNKETNGAAAKTLFEGQWADAVDLQRLAKAVEQSRVVTTDLNKLDITAKKLISELSTSDNTPPAQKTDNDNGKAEVQAEDVLKKRKLEFLKKFSDVFMKKLISSFVRYASHAGDQCSQFTKGFDKTNKKLTADATS